MNKKYATMKAPKLHEELANRGLSTEGKKAELMERLAQYLEAEYDETHNLTEQEQLDKDERERLEA
eukprot:SAG22_NODE_22463_length_198_cov_25.757576_1_plen_65_part_11